MKKILLFLLTFLACTYSAQAEDWLYLLGDFNGWSNDNTYRFKYHNGSYTLLVENGSALKDQKFKFGNNYGEAVWYGADNTGITTPYKVYPKKSNSNNMSFGNISGAVIFNVYNYQSNDKFDCAITSADLYIRGLYGNWNAEEATRFDRAGYIYTKTVTLSGATECKIADNSYNTEYGLSTAITSVGEYYLTYAGGQAGFNLPNGTYDLTFDFSTLKLTVAAHSETPSYPDIWLRGAWTTGWPMEEAYIFKTTDGVTYTLTDVNGATVKGKQWQIANSDWSYKYGSSSKISAEGTYTLAWDNNQGFDSSFPDGTYDLEYNYNTHVLVITAQGSTPTPTYPDVIYYYNGTKPCTVTLAKTAEEGTYSADITVAANEGFRFYTAPEAKDNNTSYGPTTADLAVELGADMAINQTYTNRWKIAEAGTYTFTVSLKNNTMNVVKKAETPTYPENIYFYYDSSADMMTIAAKDRENGIYEGTLTLTEDVSFRFYSDESKQTPYSYGPNTAAGPDYEAYTLGETRGMTNGSTNRWQLTNAAGEYKFTVDLKNSTFVVTYIEYWLISEVIDSWAFNDTYKFSTEDGVTYTLKNIAVTAGKQFKISDGTHYMGYGTESDGQMTIADQATGYDIYDGDKNLAWHTTITVNITYTKISDTKGNIKVEYVYPDLYLRGGFNPNGWDNLDYMMTLTDGVYTYGPISLSNCEFKIGSNETGKGNPWTWGFGSSSTEDGGELAVEADGVDFTIYDVNNGKNLKIGEVSGDVNITFIPDFTNHRGTLRITRNYTPGTGITVYVVAPKDATATPYIYRNDDVAKWPGEVMSKEVGLYYFDGTDTRDVYTYSVDATSLQWIISDGNTQGENCAWRYPADGEPGKTVTESTVVIFTSNTTVETKAYDPTLFTNVSGIEDVEISNEAPVEFYNLQGVRVDGELTPGLYIRRQGNSASKVLIR